MARITAAFTCTPMSGAATRARENLEWFRVPLFREREFCALVLIRLAPPAAECPQPEPELRHDRGGDSGRVLEREDIQQALGYAAWAMEKRVVPRETAAGK